MGKASSDINYDFKNYQLIKHAHQLANQRMGLEKEHINDGNQQQQRSRNEMDDILINLSPQNIFDDL